MYEIFPHQKVAIDAFLQKDSSGNFQYSYIADEPGLGKTLTALKIMHERQNNYIIIIAPAILQLNWQAEIIKWGFAKQEDVFFVSQKSVRHYKNQKYIIVSYNVLQYVVSLVRAFKLPRENIGVIADEAHYLKSPNSMRTKAFKYSLKPIVGNIIGLSGTPMTNTVMDFYSVISIFAPDHILKKERESYSLFGRAFSNAILTGYGVMYKGTKNEGFLKDALSTFFIRRTKKAVLKDLPDKMSIPFYFKIKKELAKESLEFVGLVEATLNDTKKEPELVLAFATIRKQLGIEKAPHVIDYVKELKEGGEDFPFVVFASHLDVIDTLEKGIKEFATTAVIKGETPLNERASIVKEFQKGNIEVLIISILAGGVGITLTASSTVILAELDFTPANIEQAIDRTHRIGQKKCVKCHIAIANDSIDQHLLRLLQTKKTATTKILGDNNL